MFPRFSARLLLPILLLAVCPRSPAMPHAALPLDLRAFAATEAAGPLPGAVVPNFRLNDHLGTARELYYESSAKAVVLVFVSAGHPRALQTASALRALKARFAPGEVVVWQIDPDPAASRTRLAAEQTLHNSDVPVLLDEAQLVAAELGATRQLETYVLAAAPAARLLYRGPLDNADPAGLAAPTVNFAADAVAEVVAGRAPARDRADLPAAALPLPLPPAPRADYAADVAPIVARRCVACHSTGNIAPHVYARFDDLASRANAIRASLLTRRMAPWHADSQYGVFANDAALTPLEAAVIHTWAKAGASRGTGADPLPAAAAAASTSSVWSLGQPDLVVPIPEQALPATGTIEYKYITVTVPVTSDRWLRAAVVRPGNKRAVHHALVFEGTLFDVLLNGGGLGGFFAGYVPGITQTPFPAGTGKLIRQNGSITFQMHYTATGQPETDRTEIGFYFSAAPPENELQTRAASTITISIPPGAANYEREVSVTPSATRDVLLYELNPHMHYRGKRFRYEARYPDGTVEVLLNVPQYNFDWQSQYRFAVPKRLPAGTVIRASGAFDNSAQNPYNPDPRATVRFGEQTGDEMFIGYLNYAELPARAAAAAPVLPANFSARGQVGQPFRLALPALPAGAAYTLANAGGSGLRLENGALAGTPAAAGRFQLLVSAANAAGSAAATVDLTVVPAATAPVFTLQPRSVRGRLGGMAVLTAAVAASPAPTYTWFFKGGEFCNTDTPVLELNDLTAAHIGDYVCVATNAAGSASSAPASVSLEFSGLTNLSARANVGTGANVVIPGITVRGTKPKTLLIRGAGPALASFGVGGTLANPTLGVFNAAGERVLQNDNWNEVPDAAALRAAASAQGAFALPEGSRDSAMLVTLPPGGYTVQVVGAGTGTAAQGVAIVEVYEADATPSTLVNLSCRARVGTGADVLIAGFAVGGTTPKRVLIRAVGPTLAALGVTGTLADPKLDLFRQGETVALASSDNWDAALAPTFANVGAFALGAGSRDAALVVTLPPGSYTAQVSGVGNTAGVALVEVYELP